MDEQYDVVVVGSGIGGLVAALTCARSGQSVLVLEAGKQFGGYTNPFARKKFNFDPGLHYIGQCQRGGSFRRLLDRLGLEHVDFAELDPDGFDHYVFPDYDVKNCKGLDRFRDRLAADFPRERRGLDRFFKLIEDVDYTLSNAMKVRSARAGLSMARRLPSVLRWSRASLGDCLDHYFTEPQLKAALAGPVGDLGLPPSRMSAWMHMALLAHYAGGAFVPRGGAGHLRDAFVEALEGHGAMLLRNRRVEQILYDGQQVRGVRTAKGETFGATQVISNASATATYGMVGEDHLPRRLMRKLRNTEYSYGSICIFMGVDGALDTSQIGSTNVWNYDSTDIDALFSEQAMGDYRNIGGYFLTVPTNKDPGGGLAPEGMQTVEIVALCGHEPFASWYGEKSMKRGEDYEALKADIADHFIERAEKHLPGLSDHVVLREVGTPATNVSYTLAPEGSAYGLAHTVDQTPPFRFGARAPLDGLYLCGASVISAGIVACAASGRMAAKYALQDAGTA
ncbi:MAG: NAD(P)/FAD-dependent oxidoreductase [Myxococcales bacterium]|nr:NAD(P)/FAD-dependent oxidoreductase [Myxococcales bacterium]